MYPARRELREKRERKREREREILEERARV